ncbi:MAG: 3-deoxy-D-manno-octulosonic acid kinase [Vibrio sp.]|uniref:3-deoxy-D-manno-octulosonic acid kinase n=1 Tax=Vibrio sp. TaxID=678 RepID=UPI003A8779AB
MSDIRNLTLKNQQIWYNSELLRQPVESCFDPLFWQQNNKITGSAQGRGTTWFVQLEQGEGALRHYRRGGLFGKLVSDSYWFNGWHNTRSYAEFKLLDYLRQQGVNVPQPVAARAVRQGCFYQADILSEKIANARDLVAVLQQQPLTNEIYQRVGQQIAKLHAAQVNHTDLNIHNILLDEQNKVWIIDFDKCYQQNGDDWKQDNLNRLLRSFNKEQQRFGIKWQQQDWLTLLQGYQA